MTNRNSLWKLCTRRLLADSNNKHCWPPAPRARLGPRTALLGPCRPSNTLSALLRAARAPLLRPAGRGTWHVAWQNTGHCMSSQPPPAAAETDQYAAREAASMVACSSAARRTNTTSASSVTLMPAIYGSASNSSTSTWSGPPHGCWRASTLRLSLVDRTLWDGG